MGPTNRRGLLGAGAAAALGATGVSATPSQSSDVDPGLREHWTRLLSLLGSQNAMFGPHEVLAAVHREIGLIAEHRRIARGELRTDLMRVEARWAAFAAWLSNDTGRRPSRDAWMDRALGLAREAGYPDMVALVHMRKSQWAAQALDADRTLAFAETALRVRGISPQTRARCALRAAFGYALANDADACERSLAGAEGSLEPVHDPASFVQPWVGRTTIRSHLRPDEARCWLHMRPSRAIPLYENVLRQWPRDQRAMGGLHQARLALACAAAGERERATVESRKALAVARTTGSGRAARELKRLREALAAA